MGKEIERKFLVDLAAWKPAGAGTHYKQGYLSSVKERVVRVRIEGDRAKLTIKGANVGLTRAEFEYDIPLDDAAALSALLLAHGVELVLHGHLHHNALLQHGARTRILVAAPASSAKPDNPAAYHLLEVRPDGDAWRVTATLKTDDGAGAMQVARRHDWRVPRSLA